MRLELDRTVALVGLRCSGKTTVGELLAGRLGVPFVDLDREVLLFARRAGLRADSVGELIETASWARFRDLEAATLKKLVEPTPRVVLATGGGVVERPDNRAWLVRATHAFYLDAPVDLLQERLRKDPTVRPAVTEGGDPAAELPGLRARRDTLYRAVAVDVVDCGAAAPEELAARIESRLQELLAPRPTETVEPASAS